MGSGLRWSIIVGASAFALSVLIGLVSRVGFAVLLVRALVFGVSFTAVPYLFSILVARFLPELLSDSPESALATEPGREGGHVDIVLPGDDEIPDPVGTSDRHRLDGLPPDDGELERETESLGAESLIPGETGEQPAASGPARPPASFDDLDVLPDLDAFASSFEGPNGIVGESSGSSDGEGGLPAKRSSEHGAVSGGDPVELASAIRTILKRDQKG
ncbi:MAG: hypothetical protein NT080_13240 [Spirochaetes bacterium]|nr:hypothetical protein [Spirochaetota bacterium]